LIHCSTIRLALRPIYILSHEKKNKAKKKKTNKQTNKQKQKIANIKTKKQTKTTKILKSFISWQR
jgi:hypothetical protein